MGAGACLGATPYVLRCAEWDTTRTCALLIVQHGGRWVEQSAELPGKEWSACQHESAHRRCACV